MQRAPWLVFLLPVSVVGVSACVTSDLVAPFLVVCGDGRIDEVEVCDDSNSQSGDGCSAICEVEIGWLCEGHPSACAPTCGDGLVKGSETCDQGSADQPPSPEDGCNAGCQREPGYGCQGEPSVCGLLCGNGELNTGERCDDGNRVADDGCDESCAPEPGYTCDGAGANSCAAICGDGVIVLLETCDQGPADQPPSSGDGCTHDCGAEIGWRCAGSPSQCVPICGDKKVLGDEQCDDHNATSLDGCSGACQSEPGFECPTVGEPCAPQCGDSLVRGSEGCDDGRHCTDGTPCTEGATCQQIGDGTCAPRDNDGCDQTCQLEPGWACSQDACVQTCGNGLLDSAYGEACDSGLAGGAVAGCDPDFCRLEPGYLCQPAAGAGASCVQTCGDGDLDAGEACDDGGVLPGDGCGPNCQIEAHWQCTGVGVQSCAPVCGDGVIIEPESCDQGSADQPSTSGDGCSATCSLEANGTCVGEPSVCLVAACGDGNRDGIEECDDGNIDACDGCSPGCQTEPARVCGNQSAEFCEPCDDGNSVSERPAQEEDPDAAWVGCPRDCSVLWGACGDGVIDAGETCDDGAKDGPGDNEFNADLLPNLDQACSNSCTGNHQTVGSPCYSTAAELDPSDPDFSNYAAGVITGCGNLPPVDPTVAEHACLRSMPSVIGDLFFPGGYCSLMAMSCSCDYEAEPNCDLSDFPGLCSFTPVVGDVEAFDESTCPAGAALIIMDRPVSNRIVNIKTCTEICVSDADCRWHQWDPVFERWGQYYCLPQILPDFSLSPTIKSCVDCRTFELLSGKNCLTGEDL